MWTRSKGMWTRYRRLWSRYRRMWTRSKGLGTRSKDLGSRYRLMGTRSKGMGTRFTRWIQSDAHRGAALQTAQPFFLTCKPSSAHCASSIVLGASIIGS